MDESDNLIALTLKQSGWNGDVPPVKTISGAELVKLISWGFDRIQNGGIGANDFKFEYPKGVAQRHRLAASLAEQFKAMGYTNDCGYNHFLYPTETDSRRMLLWLIQKLPRVEKEIHEVDTPRLQFQQGVVQALQLWMKAPREVPNLNRPSRIKSTILPATWLEPIPKSSERLQYIATKQPLVTDPSLCSGNKQRALLRLNALTISHEISNQHHFHYSEGELNENTIAQAVKSVFSSAQVCGNKTLSSYSVREAIRPSHEIYTTSDLQTTISKGTSTAPAEAEDGEDGSNQPASTDSRVQELAGIEAELQQLREQCALNENQLHEDEAAWEDQLNLNRQIEARHTIKREDLKDVEQEVYIRQQTLDMLSDASTNIEKLQKLCASNAERLMQLASEWETHRLPLVEQIKAHASSQLHRQERAKELEEEMKAFRVDMKDLSETWSQKQEQRRLLERKYESMNKGINRSMYTLRIMDIIKQVHKQKSDIQKIVRDIRSVQKQINISSEKLKRSEAIADERLFQAAKDEKHRLEKKQLYIECYRLFTTVRELFDDLINCVSECGKRENQSRDLEIWIAQMAHRVSMSNLDQIHHDMQQVKAENQSLMQEIQSLSLETPHPRAIHQGTMMLSSNEREFLLASLKPKKNDNGKTVQRADGRELLEFRQMNMSLRRSLQEHQSECELQLGRTRVLAVVSGEVVAPFPDRPTEGFLQFQVELSPMGASIFENKQAHKAWAAELSRVVERSIRDCKALDTEALAIVAGESVWAIKCTVHVLDHGGNLVDAVSIASIAALMHFRRPESLANESTLIPLSLHHIPVSISFCFVQLDANDQEDPVTLLDPTDREEKILDGSITYTFNSFRELCAVHKIGGVSISTDVVLRCANIAASKAEELTEMLKTETEKADRVAIEQRRAYLRGKEFMDTSVEALSFQKPIPLDVSGLDKAMEEIVDFRTLHAPIPLRTDDKAQESNVKHLMQSLEQASGLAITQAARDHFHQLTQKVHLSNTPAPAKPVKESAFDDSDEEEESVAHVQSEFQSKSPAKPTPSTTAGEDVDMESSDEEDLMAAIKKK